MISRRRFIAGSLALFTPLRANAQPTKKIHRIGLLERIPEVQNAASINALRHALGELGYAEGQNLETMYRSADGDDERFPGLAADLARLRPDLILARGTPASLAAKEATRNIPVVMVGVADPVGVGLIATLARPGGNVTGLSSSNVEIYPKRIQLLKELVPKLARIGFLFNMNNPAGRQNWNEIGAAARAIGVVPQLLDVRRAEDLGLAFETAARQRVDALVVGLDGITHANLRTIIELAATHRIPAIYSAREFADAGGLIAFGVNYTDFYRQAGRFVDKILKGAAPSDLPVERPTTFELVINLKTARQFGITIPQSVLLRADRVIE